MFRSPTITAVFSRKHSALNAFFTNGGNRVVLSPSACCEGSPAGVVDRKATPRDTVSHTSLMSRDLFADDSDGKCLQTKHVSYAPPVCERKPQVATDRSRLYTGSKTALSMMPSMCADRSLLANADIATNHHESKGTKTVSASSGGSTVPAMVRGQERHTLQHGLQVFLRCTSDVHHRLHAETVRSREFDVRRVHRHHELRGRVLHGCTRLIGVHNTAGTVRQCESTPLPRAHNTATLSHRHLGTANIRTIHCAYERESGYQRPSAPEDTTSRVSTSRVGLNASTAQKT